MTLQVKMNMVTSNFLLQALIFLQLYPRSAWQIDEGIDLAFGAEECSSAEAGFFSGNRESIGFPFRKKGSMLRTLKPKWSMTVSFDGMLGSLGVSATSILFSTTAVRIGLPC